MSLWLFATYEDTPMFHLQKKKKIQISLFSIGPYMVAAL